MSERVLKPGQRRRALLRWLNKHPAHSDLTASEIIEQVDIYNGHGRADRCFDDLKELDVAGAVSRLPGRPARWRV